MSRTRPLLLVGAGGFARETVEAVHAINDADPTWDLLGLLDDDERLHGSVVQGAPVLGPVALAAERTDAAVAVCTGRPSNYFSRPRIVEALDLPAERYATLVHPRAWLARSVEVGPGSILLAGVVATASVSIGAHVAVMPGVIFTHDDVVDDHATFGSGVRLGGGVRVERGAYVGAGALVREGLSVGAWATVGMGAVVTHDVPAAEVWAGVPARMLRKVPVPEELLAASTPGSVRDIG